MSSDCIFCKIANKEIPAEIIYEDEEIVGFKDLKPQAPVHFLFISKKHIATLNDIEKDDTKLIGRIMLSIKETAKKHDLAEDGYRVVVNCNKNAGQEVFHLHAHLLGGRTFNWPPG
jgi:histidine triad (HIT) family protein